MKGSEHHGKWCEFEGCTNRKRQLAMILKKTVAGRSAFMPCLQVPLPPSVSNSRVVFFRSTPCNCGLLGVPNNSTHQSPLPAPTKWQTCFPIQANQCHLVSCIRSKGHTEIAGAEQLITVPSYKGSQTPLSESAHFLFLPMALLPLYFSELISIPPVNLCVSV